MRSHKSWPSPPDLQRRSRRSRTTSATEQRRVVPQRRAACGGERGYDQERVVDPRIIGAVRESDGGSANPWRTLRYIDDALQIIGSVAGDAYLTVCGACVVAIQPH